MGEERSQFEHDKTGNGPASFGDGRTKVESLLAAASRGEAGATDKLLPLVYDELRRMAQALMTKERGGGAGMTIQPTALVHEAYMRLLGPKAMQQRTDPKAAQAAGNVGDGGEGLGPEWQNKAHFFGAAALAMRRILIDRARHVKSTRVEGVAGKLDSSMIAAPSKDGRPSDPELWQNAQDADDLLSLDEAMDKLRERDPRQHEVVMLRCFAGLTIEQTAEVMGISRSTVKNEWMYARAWLVREIERGRGV